MHSDRNYLSASRRPHSPLSFWLFCCCLFYSRRDASPRSRYVRGIYVPFFFQIFSAPPLHHFLYDYLIMLWMCVREREFGMHTSYIGEPIAHRARWWAGVGRTPAENRIWMKIVFDGFFLSIGTKWTNETVFKFTNHLQAIRRNARPITFMVGYAELIVSLCRAPNSFEFLSEMRLDVHNNNGYGRILCLMTQWIEDNKQQNWQKTSSSLVFFQFIIFSSAASLLTFHQIA